MFRLTRELRFGVNDARSGPEAGSANGYAAVPPVVGLGHFFALRVTLAAAELDPASACLVDVKRIDRAVRERAIAVVARHLRESPAAVGRLALELMAAVGEDERVVDLSLSLSPYLSVSVRSTEVPMVRFSQTFEFAASHRLHNPALSEDENRTLFGKCNNPLGHGHNYQVQVTLVGEPDPATGRVADVPAFERAVDEAVLRRFDHRHLNLEVPEFADVIPSVENIAKVTYDLLKPRFAGGRARLASVTVWETPKTWCEYGGEG